jgi:hypothetical protein
MQSFQMALESLATTEQEVEGFKSTLSIIEKDKAFADMSAYYDEALQTVISLEAFEKIINAGVTHNKKEFEPNQGLGGQLIHGLMQAIGLTGFAALGIMAIEEYDALPYEKKLAYVQEGISEWVARIWNAIRSFLARVWNWIKSLFQSKDDKKKQKLEEEANKRKAIDAIRKNKEELTSRIAAASKSYKAAAANLSDDVYHLVDGKAVKLWDAGSAVIEKLKREAAFIRNAAKEASNIGTESIDSVADSLIMVLDEIANLKPHYQSALAYYLLNTDAIKHGVGSKEEMFKALDYTKKSIVNVNNYISRYLIDPAKDASRILSQTTFDDNKALEVLKKMIPSASELNSRLGNIGDVIENQVVLSDFVGTEGLSFHCTDKDIEAAFKDSISVGDILADIGFYRGSRINFPAEKPMVELCMTQQCVERSEKAGIDIFLAYEDMIDIATKYDSVIGELQKSIEKISRNEQTAGNRQAMNFAKLVMHVLASYLNQPLGYFNVVVPRIMDALIDHTKNSNLCADPESVFSKL